MVHIVLIFWGKKLIDQLLTVTAPGPVLLFNAYVQTDTGLYAYMCTYIAKMYAFFYSHKYLNVTSTYYIIMQ